MSFFCLLLLHHLSQLKNSVSLSFRRIFCAINYVIKIAIQSIEKEKKCIKIIISLSYFFCAIISYEKYLKANELQNVFYKRRISREDCNFLFNLLNCYQLTRIVALLSEELLTIAYKTLTGGRKTANRNYEKECD